MQKGQGAIEYLLILGGATALIAILGLVIYSTLGSTQTAGNCNYDFIKKNIVIPPNGVNITNPTGCKTMTFTAGNSVSVAADFNFGSIVSQYSVDIKKQGTTSNSCSVAKTNVATTNGFLYMTASACAFTTTNPASKGLYDVNVTVYTADGKQKSAIESGAVIVN